MRSRLVLAFACACASAWALAFCIDLEAGFPPDQAAQTPRAAGAAHIDSAAVAALRLPDVRITEAVAAVPAGAITVPHCRVSGTIGREIHFRLLLPDAWNSRFMMGGGGGFVGQIDNQAQASVNSGFATVGTDTGHQGVVFQAAWALDDLDRQVNFGHVAVHRTSEVAKAIVRAYYNADPAHSYFSGCSNGGRQAMMEAQRYPDDFDGVVAGAPALDFVGIGAQFVRDAKINYPDPKNLSTPLLTADNLKFLESKILASCDAADGVKDGLMEDPRSCAFDTATLPVCAGDRAGEGCFTKAQHAALKQLYAPTANRDGVIYPAQPFGGEGDAAGWPAWITGVNPQVFGVSKEPSLRFAFGTELFKYFVFSDPAWDYSTYDLSTWKKDTRLTASILNATDPNLDAFKAKGRKAIIAHGWSDPALTPLGSVRYYQQVEARDPALRDYLRMFMEPGVLHCGGGPGPDVIDWTTAIVDWVERGKAPDAVVASKIVGGKTTRTRPLCPFPQRAVYGGSGSIDDAASFACRLPAR
jgi:feruloyl esterase